MPVRGRRLDILLLAAVASACGSRTGLDLPGASEMGPGDSGGVVPAMRAIAISAGRGHTCAVRSDGRVACWGENGHGELGNGVATSSVPNPPVAVAGLSDAISVSAGLERTCAVLSGGTIVCWGYNEWGTLGDRSTRDSASRQSKGVAGAKAARVARISHIGA
jgi:alpha-tubulin suppressor-like RCC1 family protein